MKKNFYIRVDGDQGKNVGMGHLYRSLNLYSELKREISKNYRFIFM